MNDRLVHWNPFKALPLAEMHLPFPEIVFRDEGSPARASQSLEEIRVEVCDSGDVYLLKAALPGLAKDDIEVTLEAERVSISAAVVHDNIPRTGPRDLRAAGVAKRLEGSVTLPGGVDGCRARAHYDNGMLTVTLPKRADAGALRISIV